MSGFCYLKPLCSGGIDVDHDDHDNKTRIVSDLKMTARERYDPGSLLLLLYIHGRVLFRLELQFINRLGFIFEIDNLSLCLYFKGNFNQIFCFVPYQFEDDCLRTV